MAKDKKIEDMEFTPVKMGELIHKITNPKKKKPVSSIGKKKGAKKK